MAKLSEKQRDSAEVRFRTARGTQVPDAGQVARTECQGWCVAAEEGRHLTAAEKSKIDRKADMILDV